MTQQTQALKLIAPEDAQVVALDTVAKSCQLFTGLDNPFANGIRTANAMVQIKAGLTPEIMAPVMELQGNSLGFRTDKDKDGGYPVQVVRDALIEAIIRHLPIVGNNFNILAGRFYITKEGFGTLLAQIPGLQYMITPGIPKITSQGAEATVLIKWSYNGKKNEQTLTLPIKVNSGMGADAINGKATRKARAWLYAQVTGMELEEGDVSDVPATSASSLIKVGRFDKSEKTTKQAEAIDVAEANIPANEAELIETVTSAPEKSKVQALLDEKNAPISEQDIINWHKANHWSYQSNMVISSIDEVIKRTLDWLESGKTEEA